MRLALLMLFTLVVSTDIFAKTDVVTFANGNKLIGEVKRLERGKLVFETDATGDILIDWEDVNTLVSGQNLQFELSDGSRHLGQLGNAVEPGSLAITGESLSLNIPHEEVVTMHPIESEFAERFDISVRAGYDYTKGSDVAQLNLGLDLEYRTEKRAITLDFSSLVTDNEGEITEREDLTMGFRVLREDRWFSGGLFKLQKNDELGIDLRASIGGGVGRILRENNNNRIEVLGGLLLNEENLLITEEIVNLPAPIVTEENNTTLEGLIELNYDWFRFDTPELDIKSTLSLYPGITDSGRLRAEFDLRFRWEMVEDLFWEMEYYNNYDSGRETDTESIDDYGIITSLGYKF